MNHITYSSKGLSRDEMRTLYIGMLKPRMIEEKMLILLRQGRISKWFSGIGQEAIAVGVTAALQSDEYVLPMHRNLGVFTQREMDLGRLFSQFQGKATGFTKGRDRSFHFGSNEHHIVGMISHLGPQLAVADGIALADKLRNEGKVTAVFTGDGGTSEGDFHEALNVASVWDLPVIFVIENNYYGLSTPYYEQFRAQKLSDRAIGYGMKGYTIDGNNVQEVYRTVKQLSEEMRRDPKPVLLECMTFRRRGHEEASGTKYVPDELMSEWEAKDPVENYERWLLNEGTVQQEEIDAWRAEIKKEIEAGLEFAFSQPEITADEAAELGDVYRHYAPSEIAPSGEPSEMRLVDAIQDGLRESMRKFDNLVIMGQDIAEYGGVFKITEGFVDEFGKERVRNTPICESSIIAAGLGLSVKGMKSVIEMQFADFVSSGFNNVVNNLAKSHYRWGQNSDVVVRMPTGAGVGAGPYHSQSNEAWFTHVPGLKVVYPAFPEDAKGLLIASIEDPNPVMFFEHKALYRSVRGMVHPGYFNLPIGRAGVVRQGEDLSIITYGMGVHWALDAVQQFPDWDIEIIDLRTLVPLDEEAMYRSVRKTGKALVLHEDTEFGGIGGELVTLIQTNCFHNLDAPVARLGSMNTPVPFTAALEKQFLASNKLIEQLRSLLEY